MLVRLILVGAIVLASTNARRLHAHDDASAQPPNFVFFLVDDLGWRDLGCYGSTFYETPAIDGLAAGGMRFTEAYATCPVCSPTRASVQTGRYPARMATTDWFGAPQPQESQRHPRFRSKPLLPAPYLESLPLERVTVAEALAQAGYQTFFAGKWHLGENAEHWPEAQGYQLNLGGYRAGHPQGNGYFTPYENPRLPDGPPGEHLPDRLARETADFIRSHADAGPFFAMLSFYSVHTPLDAPKDSVAKYRSKAETVAPQAPRFGAQGERKVRLVQDHPVYAAMVESMDAAVAQVLGALQQAGVAERTVVIFTSDNGGLSTSEGSPTSNAPLRAGKGWLYEGGVRTPLIVRWPGVAKPGSVCRQYVASTDYYPTMLETAQLPLQPQEHVDGESFAPLLRGAEGFDRGPVFWHYPHYGNQGGSPSAAVREGDWKLIEFYEDNRVELYNLAEDIGEQRDLSQQERQRAAALRKTLHAWQREVGARMPTINPAHASDQ